MAAKGSGNYTIYLHKNKINNKVYIGQTHQSLETRWGKNGNGYRTSPHFYAAIKKYGWDNFQHIIIKTHLNAIDADILETELIKNYNSTDPKYGYNIRQGGQHGYCYTQQQKKQLSINLRKTSHYRKNAKKVKCIETGFIFGTIADANRWANTSHIVDVLLKRRNFAGRNPLTGEKLSWEYAPDNAEITKICKEKIFTPYSKLKNGTTPVICKNTNQIFFSMKEAADWCGLKDTSNIGRCCRGLRKTAGIHPETKERLKWEYKEV